MGNRSKYDYAGKTPWRDNTGSIGIETRRWHQGWFVKLRGTDVYYSSTMTGDETFTDPHTFLYTYFLDPNGAYRTFNPSGSFDTGFVIFVKNIGTTYSIAFDTSGSNQIIRPGQLGIFSYDGTVWR